MPDMLVNEEQPAPSYDPATFVPRFPPGLRRALVIDAALPWLAVQVLTRGQGWPVASAVAAAAAFPAMSVVANFLRGRRIEWIGLIMLVGLAGAVAVALSTGDARLALLKAVPGAALFGAACLASLGLRRPLMFFVARQFTAGDDPAKLAAWNGRLDSPGFRRAMRLLTLVWGLAFLAKAGLWTGAALLLTTDAALIVIPVLGFATLGALFAWTIAFARRRSGASA
ncbi:MAG TPA: VC0807 family protein [Stellaceae bacterium]